MMTKQSKDYLLSVIFMIVCPLWVTFFFPEYREKRHITVCISSLCFTTQTTFFLELSQTDSTSGSCVHKTTQSFTWQRYLGPRIVENASIKTLLIKANISKSTNYSRAIFSFGFSVSLANSLSLGLGLIIGLSFLRSFDLFLLNRERIWAFRYLSFNLYAMLGRKLLYLHFFIEKSLLLCKFFDFFQLFYIWQILGLHFPFQTLNSLFMDVFHGDSLVWTDIHDRHILAIPQSSSQLQVLRTNDKLPFIVGSNLINDALIDCVFQRVFARDDFELSGPFEYYFKVISQELKLSENTRGDLEHQTTFDGTAQFPLEVKLLLHEYFDEVPI